MGNALPGNRADQLLGNPDDRDGRQWDVPGGPRWDVSDAGHRDSRRRGYCRQACRLRERAPSASLTAAPPLNRRGRFAAPMCTATTDLAPDILRRCGRALPRFPALPRGLLKTMRGRDRVDLDHGLLIRRGPSSRRPKAPKKASRAAIDDGVRGAGRHCCRITNGAYRCGS